MAVVIVNVSSVSVGELELRTRNESAGHAVLLLNDQGTSPLVPEDEFGGLGACGDLHTLGRPIQHETVHSLDLPRGDHGSGFQSFDYDLACGVGVEGAIARADRCAAAVYNFEGHASQRFVGGSRDVLADRQGHGGVILEGEIIAAASIAAAACVSGTAAAHRVGAVFDNDCLGSGVQNIAGRHFCLGDYHSAAGNEARHNDSPILAGGIAAQHSAAAVLDSEFRTGNGLAGDGVQLGQRQAAQGFIQEGEGLGVQGVHGDSLGLGALVNDVAGGSLDFLSHYGSGDAIDANFAFVIGGVEAVAAEMPVVIIHIAAVGVGELELSTSDQSAGHAVFL